MFEAKNRGRNNVQIFEPKMEQAVSNKASLLRDLQLAIKKKQLELYYQIQVDNNKNPFGVEALVRWVHPQKGLISPLEFIPLAEETGLIIPIGEWVLDKACAQLKDWESSPETKNLVVSINVSSKQIHDEKFPDQVRKAIQKYKISPQNLKLELTESSLLEGVEANASIMSLLKKDGVKLSLDDFGTGYSSLQYLKQLPLDELKIDRSFVKDITSDNQDRSIVNTIITLAESVGMSVLAEGVETEEQLEILIKNGCKRFQGYLFGSPIPVKKLNEILKELKPNSQPQSIDS
jgi:EAL domain-containing protein (putative c-di-GMP-specific phosphodiesterase class I)